MPVVIGITHTDCAPTFSMVSVRAQISKLDADVPVFTFDARDRAQTFHLMRALLLAAS